MFLTGDDNFIAANQFMIIKYTPSYIGRDGTSGHHLVEDNVRLCLAKDLT
jgi:hypothetical protein